jgi:hypothetical protein
MVWIFWLNLRRCFSHTEYVALINQMTRCTGTKVGKNLKEHSWRTCIYREYRTWQYSWSFSIKQLKNKIFNNHYYYYYYYYYSALGPVWAGTGAQSGDRYGSGTLHPGQVLRGSLPLLYSLLLLLLVFSPRASLGRNRSPVRRPVWLWYAASWVSS